MVKRPYDAIHKLPIAHRHARIIYQEIEPVARQLDQQYRNLMSKLRKASELARTTSDADARHDAMQLCTQLTAECRKVREQFNDYTYLYQAAKAILYGNSIREPDQLSMHNRVPVQQQSVGLKG